MSEALYTTRSTVAKIDGLHRRATLEDGTALEMGVHGPIKAHYGLSTRSPTYRFRLTTWSQPQPADYSGLSTAHWRCAGFR